MQRQEILTQKVNFFVSVMFIGVFGLFLTITVVHAIDRNASVFQNISTPIDTNV